jgi:AcrR family transcriptional regulator
MRIVSAMVQVACEHGAQSAQSATVEQVVRTAGVSKTAFYELFANRGDCLLAAIEHTLALAGERASAACETQDSWVDRVRAGLLALLEFFD